MIKYDVYTKPSAKSQALGMTAAYMAEVLKGV
jgi:hypothetical protein